MTNKLAPHTQDDGLCSAAEVRCTSPEPRPPSTSATEHLPQSLPESHTVSPAAVTEILSQNALSFEDPRVYDVDRYDVAQLAANSPCEDRFIHGELILLGEGNDMTAWGIYDGHGGCQTADFLKTQLVAAVEKILQELETSHHATDDLHDVFVQQAIEMAFTDLDDSLIMTADSTARSDIPLYAKTRRLAPSFSGSCALLAIHDPQSAKLHVACTGDSRAVLGRKQDDGKWETEDLSTDQTVKNEHEAAKIIAEHDGEEEVVQEGRMMGFGITRAFGNGHAKWPIHITNRFVRQFHAHHMHHAVITPPYMTAEPEVTTTYIDPDRPSFLIMASDGLWDRISSERAVSLVEAWLSGQDHHPLIADAVGTKTQAADPCNPPRETEKRFDQCSIAVQDKNVAVHLIRNALGGNCHDYLAACIIADPPFARRIRDDITVQVIFFNRPNM